MQGITVSLLGSVEAASRWQIEHIWRCGKFEILRLFTLGIVVRFSICSKSLFPLLFIAGVGRGSSGRPMTCYAQYPSSNKMALTHLVFSLIEGAADLSI